MACVSGKEEIEGISERVSGMKKKEDKIDALLRHNTAEQLTGVDWNELNAAISARLDTAKKAKIAPTLFKIAALTAAAAAILIIVMIDFTDKKGSATVAIINLSERAYVQVNIAETDSNRGKCDIQIIDSSTARKQENDTRPNWFVIGKVGIASTNNGSERDMRDIARLF